MSFQDNVRHTDTPTTGYTVNSKHTLTLAHKTTIHFVNILVKCVFFVVVVAIVIVIGVVVDAVKQHP